MNNINKSLFQMQILLISAKKRNDPEVIIQAFEDSVEALEQQQKTGHWIVCDVVKFGDFAGTEKYECSECHHRVGAFISNFCPNCGAKMTESEE